MNPFTRRTAGSWLFAVLVAILLFACTSSDDSTRPPADADGDGVTDASDLCPAQMEDSLGALDGCPEPPRDTDGDTFPDFTDPCPTEPEDSLGVLDGCPETGSTDLIGSWMVTAATINPGMDDGSGNIITDIYPLMPACDNDNIGTYNADSSYAFTEGVTRCNASDPDTVESGTWSLSGDQITFTISPSGGIRTQTFVWLSSTSVSFSEPIDMGDGIPRIATYTATKQ